MHSTTFPTCPMQFLSAVRHNPQLVWLQASKKNSLTSAPLVVVYRFALLDLDLQKIKTNSQKGVFLGYVPHTTQNIL